MPLTAGAFVIYEFVTARLDLEGEAVDALARTLSPEEEQRAARYRLPRDRRRFIVARGRLRALLAERLGIAPEQVEIVGGKHGKPTLAGDAALRFNLARSGELALYAFARGREIGVDLEGMPAPLNAARLVEEFFSPREARAWRALPPADRPSGFLYRWTRKEAFLKARGLGIGTELDQRPDHFDIPEGWQLSSFSPAAGFVAAVAIEA